MCCRYIGNDEVDEMAMIFSKVHEHYPSAELKHGEVFPTDTSPILFGSGIIPVPAKFGYPKLSGKGVILNAKAETVTEKVMFRDSFLCRRCVIPTTGYIEWDKNKNKYKIQKPNEKMLYLGGFCRRFDDEGRFVIITTVPNECVSGIHDRMPLILENNDDFLRKWNSDTDFAVNYLKSEMPELCFNLI